jgi:hypothetical protein
LTSGECGGGRDSRVTSRRKQGGEGEDRKREWKKSADKIVGGKKGKWGKRGLSRLIFEQRGRGEAGSNRLQHQKKRESEESKNKCKKVVVIKLKILHKKGKRKKVS